MSILSTKPEKITPTRLRNRNFNLIHWGSKPHWYDHNSKVYVWCGVFDQTDEWADNWWITYFPKNFEGKATPGLRSMVDMRGRAMMNKDDFLDYYVSPVLNTMDDLDVFIQLVLAEKYPDAHKMIKTGDLKYV